MGGCDSKPRGRRQKMRKRVRQLLKMICVISLVLASVSAAIAQESVVEGYEKNKKYQYVLMGVYPQAEDGSVEPILWRVLAANETEAFLLSEYVLFNHRIHEDAEAYANFGGQFNRTEIFGILNGNFLEEAFSPVEREQLITSEELGTVFLVSSDELGMWELGFHNKTGRMAYGTPYALKNGLFRYGKEGKGSSPYWTRSQSTGQADGVRCTKVDGSMGYIRCIVMDEGIRPAVRLSLTDGVIEFATGEGSRENPYRVEREALNR